MNDRKFFLLALALENATQKQLDSLVSKMDTAVNKYTRGGKITDVQALNVALKKAVSDFYDVFVENLYKSAEAVGDLRAKEAIEKVIPILNNAGLYAEGILLYKEIQNYGADVAKRLMFDRWAGEPLGIRIKTILAGTQKTVQNIIINGVSDGKGAKAIAKDLEQYIRPVQDITKTKPYDEYRKRFGRPKSYKPKGVPAGSVQYNALRIARTETAHIYRQATMDFYENKEFVTGYDWILSATHSKADICDDYAAASPYDNADDVPNSHPNCLCRVAPHIMSQSELKKLRDDNYKNLTREEELVDA